MSKYTDKSTTKIATEQAKYYKMYNFYRIAAIILLIMLIVYWSTLGWSAYLPVFPLLAISTIVSAFVASNYKSMADLMETASVADDINFSSNRNVMSETSIHLEDGKGASVKIPFQNIEKVVIANYAKRNPSSKYYTIGVTMIIHHAKGVYFHNFLQADEFTNWLNRLKKQNVSLYRSDYDVYEAIQNMSTYEIDLANLPDELWDGKDDELIFENRSKNPFDVWEYKGEKTATVKQLEKEEARRWMKRSIIYLFMYSLIIGGIIVPTRPIASDGFIEFDWVVIIFVYMIYVFLPLFFIYWRPKIGWYLPFFYFFFTLIGSLVSYFGGNLFNDFPPLADSIIALHLFIFTFGWLPTFIIIRVIRYFFSKMIKTMS